ncbi:MAG: 50S ribosomal protein L1 [Candidatus Nanoperiomorbaceae bacterium]
MAKTKQELLAEADKLGLTLSVKDTVAQITAAIKDAKEANRDTKDDAPLSADEVQTVVNEEEQEDAVEQFAKSGKRSAKSVHEEAAEAERVARKDAGDTTAQDGAIANIEHGPAPIPRPLSERHGKNFKKVAGKIDHTKTYPLDEAIQLAVATANTKFDSTVEIHARLGVDPKQADQNVRATVSLPNGTGKTIRVAAFVAEADATAAKAAGADIAGEAAIIELLTKENLAFDVLVATPTEMPKLGRFARLLGPRGLMPNPKAGTVSTDPAQAIKEAKAGKIEFRVDKQSIVHTGVGKVSFGVTKLTENMRAFFDALNAAKPSSLKGNYILSLSLSTTMGPGVKVDVNNIK